MKKNKFLLLSLLLIPAIVSCNSATYAPRVPFPGDPVNGGSRAEGSGGEEEELVENMTVNFYLDYSHSPLSNRKVYPDLTDKNADECEPIYTMRWYMLRPIGACPEQAILTDADAPDPELYGKFLGYSEYPSSIDGTKLWDFKQDYKQFNILNLYGIWVSNV